MRRFLVLFAILSLTACSQGNRAEASSEGAAVAAPSVLNPRLVQVDQVPGSILDISATRIVFQDSAAAQRAMLKVKDRASGKVVALPQVTGVQLGTARLTSRGVLLTAAKVNARNSRLYEWSDANAALADLGDIDPAEPLVISGSYAVWNSGSTLYRRDIDTAQTAVVANNAWTTGFDLQANGDVVYTSADGQLMRYHDGAKTQLTRDSASRSVGPVADGATVVYTMASACCEVQRTSLWSFDGTRSAAITKPSGQLPDPGGYELAGGWTAFTGAAAAGRHQVWRRGPDGVVSQLSDAGGKQPAADAKVLAISATGETVYAVADTLYLGTVGLPSVPLVSGIPGWASHRRSRTESFATYVGGRLSLAMNSLLFTLTG